MKPVFSDSPFVVTRTDREEIKIIKNMSPQFVVSWQLCVERLSMNLQFVVNLLQNIESEIDEPTICGYLASC